MTTAAAAAAAAAGAGAAAFWWLSETSVKPATTATKLLITNKYLIHTRAHKVLVQLANMRKSFTVYVTVYKIPCADDDGGDAIADKKAIKARNDYKR